VLSDPDIEPLLEELFPQHLEMFRRIRMPTAKSDVALLLMLYKFGGLHIDCHCGVRDAPLIRELLRCLDHWEVILYDKTRADQTRPATEINCLNSVCLPVRIRPSSLKHWKRSCDISTINGRLKEIMDTGRTTLRN
jgi:hypothetical protein